MKQKDYRIALLNTWIEKSSQRRKVINWGVYVALSLAAILALIPLISVFSFVTFRGFSALDWDFFISLPKPVGEIGGGIANALVGTAILVGFGTLIGLPWGFGIGIYLSEYGASKRASAIRFTVDLLASIPSIVIGLFVYAAVVVPMKRFSAYAGGIALGILMVPTVARSTEEILKLVPIHIREAGLALGLPRWKVILRIIFRGSLGALITGVMLSVARVSGETAPLLFTALSNRFWSHRLDQPIASLPVQIYNYAISPYDDWHRQAWGAALVLIFFVLFLNLTTRWAMKKGTK
ncbi:MAG TPA: phosphate ABC transporter permease PtsA [Bdellovibrionales bacterium]|nr:MAG: phosphate ABC transporter, permease protein PstA [Bdellovibrionales bacterium GWB1_52_6]OFZ03908.1 MAG: phosphate ABC transporter, permease protein PstA [Bdellovibrionales bacterium GWA1_52_35]OFZ37402.1 MAG: phosphate ABC transporter, permease protein PstA [Bdellovibrionales bacterium GWC1_52_8]HAR42719.1 phosphate ABC transporter permease PtsA [Bdellovibrionales bacterium]HCM39653.1 phosphate ABC transporter permease PtsA [Bdellovibrionales bacterium]